MESEEITILVIVFVAGMVLGLILGLNMGTADMEKKAIGAGVGGYNKTNAVFEFYKKYEN
jgi:hypothetical protein